jgi:two-component system, OmpR family, osmolarity sensor histidine kinase EnvZ
VKLWPRSLFGRLSLLLVTVLLIAVAATVLFFRQDRATLLARYFGDPTIVQLRTLRDELEKPFPGERRQRMVELSRQYGMRIVPEAERRMMGQPPGPVFDEVASRLSEALGPGTEVRIAPRAQLVLVKLEAGGEGYWVGLPMPPRPQAADPPTRALVSTIAAIVALLVAAFVFARWLARPLRELEAGVARVGRGETPAPLPESGPSEIASVNRGFNTMLANLRQIERDRAVLLAGISHDLRTPLARLRLGIELSHADEPTREGMIADIEEMDRVIGQFLDFARGESDAGIELRDLNEIVEAAVERYAKAGGKPVAFDSAPLPPLPLRPTAISRLVSNLIENALAYGAPPVEVRTWRRDREAGVDVSDRGPGIPPGDVERLKQPFTRASAARARSDGAAGAGLGLAIVDRIARLHGGRFEILPRDGGGTIARVVLPIAPR